MPQNHRLQFSVEESICFQKGQEVSELLSISLDPDIRVQEVNDYVSIRGSLELTGEYNIDQNKHTEEMYTDKRFVEQVRKREDGSAELAHCFPVDITIPKNKVSHLQDVFVFIDAFDYQLTDSRILTIQADLAIEGLLDDTQDKEPEIPLYEAPEAFREEELSEPPAHNVEEPGASSAEKAVLQDEPPELFVSKAGIREELETEKAESEPPESVASEPEAREDVKEEDEAEEPAVMEAEVRTEKAESEPEPAASEIEIQEIVKAKKETAEPAAAADVREKADSPAEDELREDAGAEESPALEAEHHSETVVKEEKAETSIHEYALRQEAQNEEEPQSDQAGTALCQEEPEPDGALENVPEAALSIEDSRESASAVYAENDKADLHFHFHQKTGSEEDSFYSAPKLLEEEEQEEESFEIEVRKTPPAEEPMEETPFQSFQLPESSETERKETNAVPRVSPAAETKEPQTKESDNSLYLTKLFTREEDEFSRMKICIVQQEDTIERLCERYEITSQQLIRMNSLALDDELKAGQILYIPQYKNSHA
ncbi:LysM peptidoglycan-binding domain-containing protein [Bacillus stercoris]|uniref:LysM peptidoglycan-binding domain-containing protein n=1 Tax=Bacillus stercoris TaxID=2054641 RepID=UPI003DA078E1